MNASRFWTITNSEIKISKGGGGGGNSPGKPKGAGGGRGDKGGGWTGRGKGGLGGGGSGGPPDLSPVFELIDINDNYNNELEAVITSIDGVDLGEFSFISIHGNAITTQGAGTNIHMVMQLSADGGDTWITGNKEIWMNAATAFHGDVNQPTIFQTSATMEFSTWIQDFNADTPTVVHSSPMKVAIGAPRHHFFITPTANSHNALKIVVASNGNSTKFLAGTFELVGYRTPKAEVQVRDFSTDPGSQWFITIPEGHTIANIYCMNIEKTVKKRIEYQLSVAGTPVSGAADYRVFIINQSDTATLALSAFDMTAAQTTNGYGHATLWNLNMPVPVMSSAEWYTVDPSFNTEVRSNMGILRKEVAYSEIRVFVASGTMNSGKIYVETYNPTTAIIKEVDFTAVSVNKVDTTGLTVSNSSALVWVSKDAISASGNFHRAVVLLDGVPDVDSSDYTRHQMNATNTSTSLGDGFAVTVQTNTSPAGGALILNIPFPVRTHMFYGSDFPTTAAPWTEASVRNAAQIENGIRFWNTAGANFNAGTFFLLGYAL